MVNPSGDISIFARFRDIVAKTKYKDEFDAHLSKLEQEFVDISTKVTNYDDVYDKYEDSRDMNQKAVEKRKEVTFLLDIKEQLLEMIREEFVLLNVEVDILQEKIDEIIKELREIQFELDELEIKLREAQENLKVAEEFRKDEVGKMEQKVIGLGRSISEREIKYLIILKLLEEGYLKDPTYDILTTLKRNPSINTIERLSQVANVSISACKDIMKKLQKYRIMNYDMNRTSNNFEIVADLEI